MEGTRKRDPVGRKEHGMNKQDPAQNILPIEMQDIIAKTLFTGAPQLKAGRSKGVLGAPGGVIQTNWELEDHMMRAARVCRAWKQAYETYLKTQTGEIFARVHEDAVSSGLDLCDYRMYEGHMPCHAQIVHSIHVGRKLLFSMRFKRTKADGQHELHAFYGVQDGFSSYRLAIPAVCCVALRHRDEQDAGFQAWRAKKGAAIAQWLGEQHAAFHGEGCIEVVVDKHTD